MQFEQCIEMVMPVPIHRDYRAATKNGFPLKARGNDTVGFAQGIPAFAGMTP